jgi:hypothetical protein
MLQVVGGGIDLLCGNRGNCVLSSGHFFILGLQIVVDGDVSESSFKAQAFDRHSPSG